MTIRVGILKTGNTPDEIHEQFGDYDDFFRELYRDYDFAMTTYCCNDGELPPSPEVEQAYIITGSKFGTYEDFDWIRQLEGFIQTVYTTGIPMVGICFGHQLIAQALGGTVEKFDGGWAVGMQEYQADGSDTPVRQLAFHQDQVTQKPKDAEVFSRSDFCQYAGLVYGRRAISVQPHPEFTNDFTRALIIARAHLFDEEFKNAAIASTDGENHSLFFAQKLGDFIVNNAKDLKHETTT